MQNNVGIYASQISGHLYDGPYGAYDSLATVTLSAATASVTFAGIPSGYKHLQVRIFGATTRGTYGIDSLLITFNGDSGSNYSWHSVYGDGSAASAQSAANTSSIGNPALFGTTTSSTFGAGTLDILDYASTNKTKVPRLLAGNDINGTTAGYGGRVGLSSGLWNNTSAITSIKFTPENGSLATYSSFALYGVK
jgi:hypothetical protein